MGFNNEGAEAIAARLDDLKRKGRLSRVPLGINIGKTRITDNKDAPKDYLITFEKLYPVGDYFTLNVSSPNTPHLRELQEKARLEELVQGVQEKNRDLALKSRTGEKPVLVKVAPDMEFAQLDEIIEVALSHRLTGIIATNASALMRETLSRPVGEPGGLSGRPLRTRAETLVRYIYTASRGRLPVIGSGGIFTAEDAYGAITAGASAVQIYTGFVYQGPGAVKRINRGLLRLLERDGFKNLEGAIGSRTRQ
jgi:dihydroorotate dehydrogenase